jgi:hypothetical protein
MDCPVRVERRPPWAMGPNPLGKAKAPADARRLTRRNRRRGPKSGHHRTHQEGVVGDGWISENFG